MRELSTTHQVELVRLRRIEGQVKGVQKMIEDKRYCIDILTQLASIIGAVKSVAENILERHLEGCVRQSFAEGSREDKQKKIEEVISILRKLRHV